MLGYSTLWTASLVMNVCGLPSLWRVSMIVFWTTVRSTVFPMIVYPSEPNWETILKAQETFAGVLSCLACHHILICWEWIGGVLLNVSQNHHNYKNQRLKTTSVCVHWIYLIHEFHNLSWITEINELFHDILISLCVCVCVCVCVCCTYLRCSLRLSISQNPPQHVGLLKKHLTLHVNGWMLCANKPQDKSVQLHVAKPAGRDCVLLIFLMLRVFIKTQNQLSGSLLENIYICDTETL